MLQARLTLVGYTNIPIGLIHGGRHVDFQIIMQIRYVVCQGANIERRLLLENFLTYFSSIFQNYVQASNNREL